MRKNGEAALFFAGFIANFKHHSPTVSGNSPVLSASYAKPTISRGNAQVQGHILSTTGHRVVMPHGTAMYAQNCDRARNTAGNDSPENYRNIGKLSALNAGGAVGIDGQPVSRI